MNDKDKIAAGDCYRKVIWKVTLKHWFAVHRNRRFVQITPNLAYIKLLTCHFAECVVKHLRRLTAFTVIIPKHLRSSSLSWELLNITKIIIIKIIVFFPITPLTGHGTDPGPSVTCKLFQRGDWVGYTQSNLLPPTVIEHNCSMSHWTCFSTTGPGLTVCHRSSISAPILNLCEVNRYELKGRVSLCLLATTRRSPTIG